MFYNPLSCLTDELHYIFRISVALDLLIEYEYISPNELATGHVRQEIPGKSPAQGFVNLWTSAF